MQPIQPTEQEVEALKYLATVPEVRTLLDFYRRLVGYYSDVRKIDVITPEIVKGRQLACDIIETEIINRLVRNQENKKQEIKEEFE